MQSVLNSLNVLEKVAQTQPIGVADLSREMNLPKSTVQRCLTTLFKGGWIIQHDDGATRWVLTSRALSISKMANRRKTVQNVAVAEMQQLQAATGEAVLLCVREGTNMVVVESVDNSQLYLSAITVGTETPIHASAAGKAILSTLGDEELNSLFSKPLKRYTDYTITDPDKLKDQLQQTRQLGYSVYYGEWILGMASVGATIFDSDQQPIAALVISWSAKELSKVRQIEFGEKVSRAAKQISLQLETD